MQDDDEAERGDAAQDCMPCGGRGTLISKLGGQESTVQCPWCEGSGKRRKAIDAQAHWGDGEGVAGAAEGVAGAGEGNAGASEAEGGGGAEGGDGAGAAAADA